ncbi:MAG: universal stress protein, partial [Candidatus Bathyarchaeota archaeon]
MRKILVPVDGSDSSRLAMETAARVAHTTGATVTVLHVIREMEQYYRALYAALGREYDIPHRIIKEILNLSTDNAKTIINEARVFYSNQG